MFVLHHHDFSSFSEKVRLAFGIKGAAWRSVQTPLQRPKPMLLPPTAVAGGSGLCDAIAAWEQDDLPSGGANDTVAGA